MKLPTAYSVLLLVGLALFAGGVVSIPAAEAACLVVVAGSCGTNCNGVTVAVGCGTNNCYVVVASDCAATGFCVVTTTDLVDQPSQCGGSCEVNAGFCDFGGAAGDGPANCTVNVGTCLGNGDCTVNVASNWLAQQAGFTGSLCNGDCLVNLFPGACSSTGPGHCTVNLGLCYSDCLVNGPAATCHVDANCAVNLGDCYGRCTVNVVYCAPNEVCSVELNGCLLP